MLPEKILPDHREANDEATSWMTSIFPRFVIACGQSSRKALLWSRGRILTHVRLCLPVQRTYFVCSRASRYFQHTWNRVIYKKKKRSGRENYCRKHTLQEIYFILDTSQQTHENRIKIAQMLIQVYLVLAVQVSLQIALEVRLVIADGAMKVRWFTACHFLM